MVNRIIAKKKITNDEECSKLISAAVMSNYLNRRVIFGNKCVDSGNRRVTS